MGSSVLVKEPYIIIKEGATYDFLPHGFVSLIVLGSIGFVFHPIAGFIGTLIGIAIMSLRAGVQIDIEQKRIRRYHALFYVRYGKWFSLKNVISGKLVYNRQSSRKQSGIDASVIVGMGGVGASQMGERKGMVKTYDLMFEEDTGENEIFHSYTAMKPAFDSVKILNDVIGFPVENQLLTMQKVLGKNRRR
jgi:hypothetical protein